MEFDDIIVGAGSSGAVLAARLSEDTQRQVLLLEAGPDYPEIEKTPTTLLNGHSLPNDHDWGFTAEMVPGRSETYPRGKVTGGSSAVNACFAPRGTPADYDEWAALGNPDWAWAQVLPIFAQLENDQDIQGDYHGNEGPTPVRRYTRSELTASHQAFVDACLELGFPFAEDHNHPDATGIGTGPWNVDSDGVRVSTAIAYLQSARQRSNLTIKPNSLIDRVLLDGNRAVGVILENGGTREQVYARRITLCAGAIGSPTILLRSGIGPDDDLHSVGIEPQISLPGVGTNLIDHAGVGLRWTARAGVMDDNTPMFQTVLRYTAPHSNQANDMQVLHFQLGSQGVLGLSAKLMKPQSIGSLKLRDQDPHTQPFIQLNLASDPEDVRRLAEGFRLLGRFVQTPQFADQGAHTVNLDDGETLSTEDLITLIEQEGWLEAYIQRTVSHYVHPVGTVRMGPDGDPGAVVDQRCRVRGVSNLRVVDASVMPTIPSANTNLTCIMIGERVASWMREETE